MNIADIALEIYQELGEPSDTSASVIIYWLSNNIGTLNLLLDASFVVNVDNSTTPDLGDAEKVIFKLMYQRYYYNRLLNNALSTASYGNPGAIISVLEGNRSIKLANGSEIAKTYQSVVAGINESLNMLVQAYKMNSNVPLEVTYDIYPDFPYLCGYGVALPPF